MSYKNSPDYTFLFAMLFLFGVMFFFNQFVLAPMGVDLVAEVLTIIR